MKESELYANYIKASRAGNKREIDRLLQMGFRPDKQRLIELSNNNKALKDVLYNRNIIINIDMGNTAGHVYGNFPIYNEKRTHIKEELLRFYPKGTRIYSPFVGEGIVLNETEVTKRPLKQYQTVQIHLPITEEAWVRLAHWTSSKTKEKNFYVLVNTNCVHFVHSALRVAGYSDGLIDKFDPIIVNKMKIKPVMLDLNAYLRYDNREVFFPLLNNAIESRTEALQNGTYVQQHKIAMAKRTEANQLTQQNFVESFFAHYHDANFYQRLYQNKPVLVEDMSWLLRNKAPGMENKIKDILLQSYQNLPVSIKQQYQFNPKYFLWDMGYRLQTCPESIDPEIHKLISIQEISAPKKNIPMVQFKPGSKRFISTESFRVDRSSNLPTFFYLNPSNSHTRQCHQYLAKEKSSAPKSPNNPYVKQVFSRDCEQRLNAHLGIAKAKHETIMIGRMEHATTTTPSFKDFYIRRCQPNIRCMKSKSAKK